MAASVAPLTTVVMTSVEQDHAGTASGVNNAVARVAGVLAIAVLGLVMVSVFRHSLQHALVGLNLAPGVLRDIQSNTIKLAGLELPTTVDATTSAAIRAAIAKSFVLGFRVIMMVCAGLAVASSVVVAFMIRPSRAFL